MYRNSGVVPLRDYADAKGRYETTEPIRGKGVNAGIRPLGHRRKTQFQICKNGDDIICQCYDTHLVTFHPDNTITLHVPDQWRSQTTANFIFDVLGRHRAHVSIKDHDVVVMLRGQEATMFRVGEATKLQVTENGRQLKLVHRDRVRTLYSVDRTVMNAARKSVAEFSKSMLGMLKLKEGKFEQSEFDELGKFLHEHGLGHHTAENTNHTSKITWTIEEIKDYWIYSEVKHDEWFARTKLFIELAKSGDSAVYYPLVLWLAFSHGGWRIYDLQVSVQSMKKMLDMLLMVHTPNALVAREEALGAVERCRYRSLDKFIKLREVK